MERKTNNFFSNLYYLKKYQLMQENIQGEKSINMDDGTKMAVQGIANLQELYSATETFMEKTKKSIPAGTFEEWMYADSEVYTDKYHHRKFANEIENSDLVNILLEKFVSLYDDIHVFTDSSRMNKEYNLRLYDFNDYDLYFLSEQDAELFASEFILDTYTLFKMEDGVWIEQYSV